MDHKKSHTLEQINRFEKLKDKSNKDNDVSPNNTSLFYSV